MKTLFAEKTPDPYRILFPVGILFGVLGVLPWIFHYFGLISFYPQLLHSRMMVLGFLMSFVCGFLMTAAPRMTGTRSASAFEISLILVLLFLQTGFALSNLVGPSALLGALQFLALISFLISRIRKKSQSPPSSFVFVPFGIFFGFLGTLSFIFQEFLSPSVYHFGKILLFQAFILNLIVGLGGRLIPVLSRVPGALDPTQKSISPLWPQVGILTVLNFSFIAEAFIDKGLGVGLRFLILSYILIFQFKIFHKPSEKTWLRFCLRIAAIFMTLPYLLILFWPAFDIYLLHMTFISGFGLMTLMVAVRVTLAHGGHSLAFEKQSKTLPALALLFFVAMVFRSLAPLFAPQYLLHFLACASIFWILALGLWAFIFWPKMASKRNP